MNRTIKDATVKRYFYESNEQVRTHLRDFGSAYNFAEGSRPSKASPLTNSSVKHGLHSPSDSNSTRSSKCRDQTNRVKNFQPRATGMDLNPASAMPPAEG